MSTEHEKELGRERIRRFREREREAEQRKRDEVAATAQKQRLRKDLIARYGQERVQKQEHADNLAALGQAILMFFHNIPEHADCDWLDCGVCRFAGKLPTVNQENLEQALESLSWMDSEYVRDPELKTFWDIGAPQPGFVKKYYEHALARYRGLEPAPTPAEEIAKIQVGSIVRRNDIYESLHFRVVRIVARNALVFTNESSPCRDYKPNRLLWFGLDAVNLAPSQISFVPALTRAEANSLEAGSTVYCVDGIYKVARVEADSVSVFVSDEDAWIDEYREKVKPLRGNWIGTSYPFIYERATKSFPLDGVYVVAGAKPQAVPPTPMPVASVIGEIRIGDVVRRAGSPFGLRVTGFQDSNAICEFLDEDNHETVTGIVIPLSSLCPVKGVQP